MVSFALQRPRRPVRPRRRAEKAVIDLSAAHVWDDSSVAALDAIETKYAQRGKTVETTGLNNPSAHLHGRLTGELAAGH
jgi:SulP family sulfate permease